MKLHRYDPDHVWENGHRKYRLDDGTVLPGVTTILRATQPEKDKAGIEKWKAEVGEDNAAKELRVAGHRGHKLHAYIEAFLLRGEPGPWLDPHWESMEPVLRKIDDVHLLEGAVWHPSGWAGTVDCVARYEGVLGVLDWKSKKPPKKRYRDPVREDWILDYRLQAGSAYPLALEHVYPGVGRLPGFVVVAVPGYDAPVFRVEPGDLDGQWMERVAEYGAAHGTHRTGATP